MGNDWEDDDFFDDIDDGESTDMGDKTISPSQPTQNIGKSLSEQYKKPQQVSKNASRRVVKIKPMPLGMRQKWPDVVSCLLTLSTGKQVMFVKG